MAIVLLILVVAGSDTDTYDVPSGYRAYSNESLIIILIFLGLYLVFITTCFVIRENKIYKIFKHGIIENMEIIDLKWSWHHCECTLNYHGKNIKTDLRVSKKNKSTFEEYCKIGNIVPVAFIEDEMKDVFLIELYRD